MFTFTDKEVGSLLTDEKCFNDLFDLYYYNYHYINYKLVLVLENNIMYELPLKMISVKWAVACAERSLHFFEEERPNDNRPKKAIEAAQQWIINQTDNDTDDAYDAAHAAHAAAYAAAHAAHAAAYTAYAAAAISAYAAAAHAVRAAHAAHAARVAYVSAVNYPISDLFEQKWSRNKLKEIVGEYINDYKRDLKFVLTRVRVNIIPELSDIIIKYVV